MMGPPREHHRGPLVALWFAVALALIVLLVIGRSDPRPWVSLLLASGPLLVIGLPALLILHARRKHGDEYDVTHLHR